MRVADTVMYDVDNDNFGTSSGVILYVNAALLLPSTNHV